MFALGMISLFQFDYCALSTQLILIMPISHTNTGCNRAGRSATKEVHVKIKQLRDPSRSLGMKTIYREASFLEVKILRV